MIKKIDEIKTLKFEEKQITVSALPEALRNQVDDLQGILQKRVDMLFEIEILDLASKMKLAQINDALSLHLKSQTSPSTGETDAK